MHLSRAISSLKNLLKKEYPQQAVEISRDWRLLQYKLEAAHRIIDLGCGANPHLRASIGVDAFIQPLHRQFGHGPQINPEALKARGCQFVQAELSNLPFTEKEFDFAYSHHALEHVPDPKAVCTEIIRIAHAGAIITLSPFAEMAFDRPYHLWMVFARGNTLFFVRKRECDDRPFGEHPELIQGQWCVTDKTNPFDILLNDDSWYRGREGMPRLSKALRRYWYSHSSILETVFLWERSFNYVVIHEDGRIE